MSGKEEVPRQETHSISPELDENRSESIRSRCERKYPRTDLTSLNKVLAEEISFLPIDITTSNCDNRKGMIMDISENGCRIAVTAQLHRGEKIEVSFAVNRRTITSMAVVRWILPQNPVYMVGLEFQEMADDIREYLWAVTGIASMDSVEIDKMKEALEEPPGTE